MAYQWDFGDGAYGGNALAPHTYLHEGTYPVSLTVTDNGGLSNAKGSMANVQPGNSGSAPYTVTQDFLPFDPAENNLTAFASLLILPPQSATHTPLLKVRVQNETTGSVLYADPYPVPSPFVYSFAAPQAGHYVLNVEYYWAEQANPSNLTLLTTQPSYVDVAVPPPTTAPQITGVDAIWWFGGAVGGLPPGFATSTVLSDPNATQPCTWTILQGADRIQLLVDNGPISCSAEFVSTGPSMFSGDVQIQVEEGGLTSGPFSLTVLAPTRIVDSAEPYDLGLLDGYNSTVYLQLLDQFYNGIGGAGVLEHFSGGRFNWQPNNWNPPSAGPEVETFPGGDFTDDIFMMDCTPASCVPMPIGDPLDPNASDIVYELPDHTWTAGYIDPDILRRDTQEHDLGRGRDSNAIYP